MQDAQKSKMKSFSRRKLKEFFETKVVKSLERDLCSSDTSSNDDEEEILFALSELVIPPKLVLGTSKFRYFSALQCKQLFR